MPDDADNVVPFPRLRKSVDPADVARSAHVTVSLCDGDLSQAIALANTILKRAGNREFALAVVAELECMQHKANNAK